MGHSSSGEANSCWAGQKSASILWNLLVYYMITRARYWCLSWARRIHSKGRYVWIFNMNYFKVSFQAVAMYIMQGISGLAEDLLALQQVLCSVWLVGWLVRCMYICNCRYCLWPGTSLISCNPPGRQLLTLKFCYIFLCWVLHMCATFSTCKYPSAIPVCCD
jgi:hypothetical protein